MAMNYSVFKLQQTQGGKPGIFWEKETIPKNDRKFGYKKKSQRFPVRRFPGDSHHIETDMVSLTPDEPQPPPKPAKNFIKRNKEKIAAKNKQEPAKTVTLTQEQLNAILKSVGNVAGGSEHAVKISIDKASKDRNEILIESPRRHDRDDSDYEDHRRDKKHSRKKEEEEEEGGNSIYSFLDNQSKQKTSKEKKSRKDDYRDDEDDRDERETRKRRQKSRRDEEEEDNRVRDKNRRNRSRHYDDDDDDGSKERRRRNKSKHRSDDEDDDNYDNVRRRRNRSKRRDDSDYEEDIENRAHERKERIRKSEKDKLRRDSKERQESRDKRDSSLNDKNESEDHVEELPSPREKIGLPMDLSWRHMTKAEKRRLEIARQKVIDEEERKEEDRIRRLNARYGGEEEPKLSPQRHKPPRSDPATRLGKYSKGRDTETSNYTDGYRRGRRSNSPEERRSRTPDRSPEIPSHHSPYSSPKVPPLVPKGHMTLAEKKRLEWERDRVESVQLQRAAGGNTEPWGRPGAGAPLRTRSGHVIADYKGRQEHIHNQKERPTTNETVETQEKPKIETRARKQSPPSRQPEKAGPLPPTFTQNQQNVPHAMRSSFVLGNAAPDYNRFESAKERERKEWLAELEKQIEEKKMKEMKNTEVKEESTWADKLGTYRPVPFPDQPKDTVSGQGDPYASTKYGGEPSQRDNKVDEGDEQSYIRGQNVTIDPVTKKELESKRARYLEHQAAVKAQVEEKERQKRMERERKIKEDMDEERKLQAERDMLQKQFEMEQQKQRQKEQQRQEQVNQLKVAMDEAQARALQEKYQRKMQHLEAGGHDTSKLREHLEGEITSRIEQLHTRRERDILKARQQMELQFWGVPQIPEESLVNDDQLQTAKITPRSEHTSAVVREPTYVPGLDLSTTRTQHHHGDTIQSIRHEAYTEDRILTPSRFRHPSKPHSDPSSPRREFGTQTGGDIVSLLNGSLRKEDSDVQIEYQMERGKKVRVVSAPKQTLEKRTKKPQKVQERKAPPSYREQISPHEHHHHVRKQREKEEEERRKKLEMQRRKGPVRAGSRPMWGYKNPDLKKPAKQSEKDPFYQRKKRESEMRRLKREQKLLAMVEANKDVIPDYYVPPSNRSRSRSRDPSPFSDFGGETPRQVKLARRSKSHSPNRAVVETDYLRISHDENEDGAHETSHRKRDRSKSPVDNVRVTGERPSRSRNKSPPVPAIRHKNDANQSNAHGRRGGRYGDIDPLDIPVQNGDFVPFTRTIDVLDPVRADEPLPLSREATKIANARKMYYESLAPEKFGNKQKVYQDINRVPGGHDEKNPLLQPSLVMDHPTSRQDQILVQLSTLKQSLMQRQRELETFSPTDLEKQDTGLIL